MPDDLILVQMGKLFDLALGLCVADPVLYLGPILSCLIPCVAGWAETAAVGDFPAVDCFGRLGLRSNLQKPKFGDNNTRLMSACYVILVGCLFLYVSLFGARSAAASGGSSPRDHVRNVFFNLFHAETSDRGADPQGGAGAGMRNYAKIAKQRSNVITIWTLPVIFLMSQQPLPMAFASEMKLAGSARWYFLMGVTIRHFTLTACTRCQGNDVGQWAVTALLFFTIMWLSTAPMFAMSNPSRPLALRCALPSEGSNRVA